MRYILTTLAILLVGCAAHFQSQPTTYWGFHETVPQAPALEAYVWASTEAMCQLLRANEIATSKKNEIEGKFAAVAEPCRRITVTAGGSWWGFTSGALPGAGSATPTKQICDMMRSRVQSSSLCSPVRVE